MVRQPNDAPGGSEGPRPSRLETLDRRLGCLLWKPLLFLCVLATAGSIWAALAALREATGGVRWAGFALGLVAAMVFGAAAIGVARKRGISEIEP